MTAPETSASDTTASDRPTVFFHIGAPKTGTTFLQSLMWRDREQLRADGLLYPGRTADAHFEASLDLRRMAFLGHRPKTADGAWAALVREIREWGGNAIIDHELFAAAEEAHIAQAIDDLSFADVHIVYTVRDLARQIPAAWQERMKNRSSVDFATFLRRIQRTARRPGNATFWRMHDVPRILRRWADYVPPERIHVVTLPPPGQDRGALWQRFARTIGVDPSRYDTRNTAPNESIGAADAALLRYFNSKLGRARVPWPVYSFIVKERLAPRLAARSSDKIGLPEDVYRWTVRWARGEVRQLARSGYDIVGDLNDLIPNGWRPGVDPNTVELNPWAVRAADAGAAVLRLVSPRPKRPAPRPGTRPRRPAARR